MHIQAISIEGKEIHTTCRAAFSLGGGVLLQFELHFSPPKPRDITLHRLPCEHKGERFPALGCFHNRSGCTNLKIQVMAEQVNFPRAEKAF